MINTKRVDVREAPAPAAFDIPNIGAALVPLHAHAPVAEAVAEKLAAPVASASPKPSAAPPSPVSKAPTGVASTSRLRWIAGAARVVRNAAIAVAVMALVPIGLATFRGSSLADTLFSPKASFDSRVAVANAMRPYALPVDPAISPMQAGLAFNAMHGPGVTSAGFELRVPLPRPAASWRNAALTPDMFPSARPDWYSGPSSRHVLEAAAAGLSPREMDYLHTLATAPLWRNFDLVARARAVDIIAGRFQTPFGPEARSEQRPTTVFRDSKELAYASVARAAYHLALGQRDSAESALRGVVSFGFTFIDNGSTRIDELIGVVIVGIGRDALARLYAIEHDPRANDPALLAQWNAASAGAARAARLPMDEARQRLLKRIEDPTVPLGERFEELRWLSATSCTNPRELIFGPRADVTDLLHRARRSVARFPSEEALVDLETRMPAAPSDYRWTAPIASVAVSMASVAGAVLDNPRFARCTAMLTGNW